MVREAGQEIQLLVQPEWVNQSMIHLFDEDLPHKALMSDLTLEQQTKLIEVGLELFKARWS